MDYDVEGARKAGLSDADIAGYLAQQSGYDIENARKAGVTDEQIVGYLVPPPIEGGFKASAKQIIGSTIKGAGQAAADFIPGVDQDNALKRYGQEVVDANPTAVRGFQDIADKPLTTVTEATGNAAGSMAGMVGARLVGQGITAASPLAGPLAPAVAAVGQAIAWLGPVAIAALPSFSGIRDKQILNDPENQESAKSKAVAALGAAAVGAIEIRFGPQNWALAALTKEGRATLAKKFAATTLTGSVAKAAATGAAVEGAEELVQNPIEQVASGDDPTTREALSETAFGGTMGAVGGGVLGGGFGLISSAQQQEPAPVGPAPQSIVQSAADEEAQTAAGVAAIQSAQDVDAVVEAAIAATSHPGPSPIDAITASERASDQVQQGIIASALRPSPKIAHNLGTEIPDLGTIVPNLGTVSPVDDNVQLSPEGTITAPAETAPKTVGGIPVSAQSTEQLQAVAQDPETPATTRHAAVAAVQSRIANPDNVEEPIESNQLKIAPQNEPIAPEQASVLQTPITSEQVAEERNIPTPSNSMGLEVPVAPGTDVTPAVSSHGMTYKRPNTLYVFGVDWSSGNQEEIRAEEKHSGDPAAALSAFKQRNPGIIPQVIVATDAKGKPWKVVSPNGQNVHDFNSPEGRYTMGDVDAFRKASAAKIEEGRQEGDPDKVNAAADTRIAELNKRIAETQEGIARNLKAFNADRAKQKAGMTIAEHDGRFGSWKEYHTNAQRILDAQSANLADQQKELAGWEAQKVGSVQESALSTKDEQPKILNAPISANAENLKEATVKESLPVGPEVERFQGQYKKGMSERVANQQQTRLTREQQNLVWTVEKTTVSEFPDRFDVVGRKIGEIDKSTAKPVEAPVAAQPATPAQSTATPEIANPAPISQAEPAKAPAVLLAKPTGQPVGGYYATDSEGNTIGQPKAGDAPRRFKTAKEADIWARQQAKKAAKPAKQPKAKQGDALKDVREFYTPGNIVYVDYWKQHDKVLDFKDDDGSGHWAVKVQNVEKKGDEWVPTDKPRWHSTMPGKDAVVEKATPAEAAEPETTAEPIKAPKPSNKPRMGETADELFAAVKKAGGGILHEGRILYPTVRLVAGGGDFRIGMDGKIEAISSDGRSARDATKAQADDVHDAIEKDQAMVVLRSGWGGSGDAKSTASKDLQVLHSPSGNSFEQRKPAPSPAAEPTTVVEQNPIAAPKSVADMSPADLLRAAAAKMDEAAKLLESAPKRSETTIAETKSNVGTSQQVPPILSQKQGGIPDKNEPLFSKGASSPIFYSALARGLESANIKAAPAAAWRDYIKGLVNKGAVKQDEVEWTGINDWLATQTGKVTKEQVQAFMEQGGVKVTETELKDVLSPSDLKDGMQLNSYLDLAKNGDKWDVVAAASGEVEFSGTAAEVARYINDEVQPGSALQREASGRTKFSDYQLPGSVPGSYRELVLTLPQKAAPEPTAAGLAKRQAVFDKYQAEIDDMTSLINDVTNTTEQDRTTALTRYHALLAKRDREAAEAYSVPADTYREQTFESGHFPNAGNYLAHTRVNDRILPDGRKVLFVEEIQSDRAQKGRQEGFATPVAPEQKAELQRQLRAELDENGRTARARQIEADLRTIEKSYSGIAPAPFVTKTDRWTALVLKRLLRYAAEGEYDAISWTRGEQQVERYTSALRKAVDTIEWKKTPEGVQIVGYKGSEIAATRIPNAVVGAANRALGRNDYLGFDTPAEAREAIWDARNDWSERWEIQNDADRDAIQEYVEHRATETRHRRKVVDTTEKESALSDAIGKSMADRIRNDPNQTGTIEGDGITVSDTGMAGYYDRIVPKVAQEVAKKVGGGKVIEIDLPLHSTDFGGEKISKQQALEITPAMREKIMAGQALFSQAGRDISNIETATRRMGRFVDEFSAGKLKDSDTQILGDTPTVLRALGAPNLPLQINGATIRKVLAGKYKGDVSEESLRNIAQGLYDPIAVFKSSDQNAPGSKVLITELASENGKPIVAIIHVQKRHGGMVINDVASIHEKTNAEKSMVVWIARGLLQYVRNESALSNATRHPLPASIASLMKGRLNRILSEADIVKQFGPGYSNAQSTGTTDTVTDAMRQRGLALRARIEELIGDRPDVKVKTFMATPESPIGMYSKTPFGSVITMALNAKDELSIADHEGYHAAEDLILSDTEKAVVGQAMQPGRPLYQRLRQAALTYDKANGTGIADEIKKPAEARAYGFEFYRRGALKADGVIGRIYQKLQQFFERVQNAVNGLGFKSAEDVFDALGRGQLADRVVDSGQVSEDAGEFQTQESRGKDDQTQTPEFKKWFGASKVVDAEGKPLVVYHGTNAADIKKFKAGRDRNGVLYFSADPDPGYALTMRSKPTIYPVYLSLQNPFDGDIPWHIETVRVLSKQAALDLGGGNWEMVEKYADVLRKAGFDGALVREHYNVSSENRDFAVFSSTKIKSAIGNTGAFDPTNPDIRFSRAAVQGGAMQGAVEITAPDWVKEQPAEMQETLRKAGAWKPKETLQERFVGWTDNWQQKLKQGMVDQFDPVKSLDYHAYMLARMSKSSAGPLESALFDGTVFIDKDGAVDVNYEKGGFIGKMQVLKGEHDRFFAWVIGRRAERLMAEGREHNFTKDDIGRLKTLNQGKMTDGAARAEVYMRAAADLNRYNKSIVDIAEKAGLIDAEARPFWEKDFYIPFYRMVEGDTTKGPVKSGGLVRQYAFKTLKGGEQAIGDPMSNILRNWAHLIDASLKNQAGVASLDAAVKVGVARETTADEKNAVFVMKNGQKTYYAVDDPFVLDAINSLGFSGFSGPAMKVMSQFKRWLTYGVTISPTFRIRNVIRDSLTMIGTNQASYNVLDNVLTGWRLTKEDSPAYASMIAGGGVIRFGTLEQDGATNIKRIVASGVDAGTILDNPAKVKAMLKSAYDWWMRTGDRSENVNRAALYQKLRDEGKSHLEASYAARDTMDFSMMGTWSAIRFLAQTVPFLNARLQGLYKLGRGAAEDPRRFAYVVGATALASMALLLAYKDDDDWKSREDFDRESFWWFRIGDKAFRIPKPFEIGALGTLAERGLEALVTDELTGKQFAQRMGSVVMQQLSMNPVPQLFMPMIEVWANKDSFTGRAIESMGMEKLSPSERIRPYTSAFAQLAGKNGVVSPVQIDHIINGYFGWLGTHAVATADLALRPVMDMPAKPAMRVDEVFALGDFVRDMPAYQSKYVTRLYEQSREVQQVMADMRAYQKIGATEKAAEILKKHGDKIKLYRLYTHAEKQLTQINQQIKMAQRRPGDADAKRVRLDQLYAQRNRVAKLTEQRAQSTQR